MYAQQANVDTVGRGGSPALNGLIAKLMANGMNPAALRTNDVLYNRDWILVDKTILQVSRERLIGVADLFAAGLTFPVTDAMGVTRIEWEKVSDMGAADVNMSGVAEGLNERVLFGLDSVPLPIVHKDFNINIRALTASRRMGHPLDVTQVALATRIVTEKVEDMLFNGGPVIGNSQGTIYGYTTAPNAHTGTLTYDWSQNDTTGEHKVADLLVILQALYAGKMYGPYGIYVPNSWYINMQDDFKANGDRTQLERLLAIPGIRFIKPSFSLTTSLVVVQMTSDVVDMIDGIQPMAVNWESHGGMVQNFKVMCILVPRMKSTYTNQSGIAVYANGATHP